MKSLFFRDRSGSVFVKVLYSYILIITLPMILFGLASYYWLTHAMENETHGTYSGIAADIRAELNRNFQVLDTFAVQLSYFPWATKLMNMEGGNLGYDRLDIGLLLNIIQELRIFQATYPFIDEMAVDFRGKDTIISTVGKDNRERFFSDLVRYKRLAASDWSGMLERLNNRTMLPVEEMSVLNQSKRMLTYMHALPPGDSNFQATLLLFIKEETIQDMLGKSALVQSNGSVYITDREGRPVTGYRDNPAIRAALLEHLQNGTPATSRVSALRTADGAAYTLYQSEEGANGWTYQLIVPTSTLTAQLKSIRLVAGALILFYLIVGITVSYMLASRDYRPIRQIMDLVRSRRPGAEQENNEFRVVESAIYTMLKDADRNENEIMLYKPFARNTCLAKLLRDEKGHAETAGTLELLDLSFPHEYYRCIVLLLSEEQLVPDTLQELLKSKLDPSLVTHYWVELDGKTKAVILSAESLSAAEEAIAGIGEGLLSMSVAYRAIGVGRLTRRLSELHLSYAEACRALEYRFIQAEGSTLYAERFSEAVYWKAAIQEEHELIAAIRNGQAALAVEKAHRIVLAEVQTYRLPLDSIRFLCYRVATVALVALEELNIAELPAVNWNELLQQDELDAMLEAIRRLYEEAVRLADEARLERNDHLIRELRAYLETHYTDQNLSLTAVADKFGISSSYLSRYFKTQTGTNFVDYVNRCRIEASKRHLTGEATILQIAHKVGFDNDITFRRLFKKYMGVTPSQYKGAP
ncbi:helix-turn-helix domain-containing protein [Paenibacillus koleovorans]|uniref:helix-turn-helix domain-containing protein n=1 Tax=Paenibacillus koleovorans TaxID=121608 RepID=UPI000FDBE90D|nr:helix-turn-helix domain-containing protein [Paenibacillus koleovorans]